MTMNYYLRRTSLFAVLFSAFLLLPAFASASQVPVSIMDNFFAPQSVTVNVGDTVVWKNNGSTAHTVVADSGAFATSEVIAPGQTFAVTLNNVGSFPYHDQTYGMTGGSGMSGTIQVVSGAVQSPTYTPTYTPQPTQQTSGTNVAQLQAQIQSLLAQIQAMQGSISGGTSAGATVGAGASAPVAGCPQITHTLQLGDSGSDVSALQQFLARDTTVYPEGLVTGYFGSLTESAVQRWQAKYNIVSSGTASSTGYGLVGPRTGAAITNICSGGTTQASGAPVGGYISVSPVSGTAPLSVNITATVNTTASCLGATYTINFGDESAPQLIPVPPGNCGQLQQTYTHVYQYGGTYQVTLSAGSHTTSATVTVAGPAAPGQQLTPVGTPTGTPNGTANGTPSTQHSQSPVGTISAFTTSGTAPFKVTFYVSCRSAVAYNVVFGDGTDLGSTNVGNTSCDGSLQSVTHTYTTAGSYNAQLVLFYNQPNGTVGSETQSNVNIAVSSVAANYSYNPPVLSSGGSSPLAFTLQFDLPTSCTGYNLSWGDGTSAVIQNDGGSSCAQTAVTITQTHTYANYGSYTVTLKRGPSLSRSDNVSVSITQ